MQRAFEINPDRWADISRVFSAAAQLAGAARDAFLDTSCRDDRSLRAAVESMLAAHEEAGSFGDVPMFALPDTARRLVPGSQLGAFRIETLLGAGGMGEVYRAYDTRLERAVALKVLPDSFAHDPDRRTRFEAEARALAALNHPHVGAIYGVEDADGVAALVLELVDGPTLGERLAAGGLRPTDIVRIARQLAQGLEAAHDRGIVHRDLKPGNIKIDADGNVKIIDFGLAKTAGAPAYVPAESSSASRDATRVGVIVGTAGYMSPEQARGEPVDKRTDIWAFGCVVFEMCARQAPFSGATVTDTLAAVVEREPSWDLLPADTPPALVHLLRRCLTKDPKQRLRDIGEARIALEQDVDAAPPAAPSRRSRPRAAAAVAVGVLALTALTVPIYTKGRSTRGIASSPVRFLVPPPDGGLFNRHPARNFLALSPDGTQLAFLATTGSTSIAYEGRSQIWIRALADLDAHPVPGTEGATAFFWSPNGRSLAFFADGKLKRLDLPAGAAVTICDVPGFGLMHGTWGAGGTILMGIGNGTAILGVPASGGVPDEVLTRDAGNHEVRVHWPWFLPDGRRFFYTVRRDDDEGELRLAELGGGSRTVMRVTSNVQWVDPDIVVFVREGVLMGQRVDLAAAAPIGEPFSIVDTVDYFFTTSRGMFSVSRTGSVAYHAGGEIDELVWVDQHGREVGTVGSPAEYQPESARLSRDETMLLTARTQPGVGTYDIWRIDLVRRNEDRITADRGSELTPVWIDDDRAMVYAADSGGSVPHLFRKDLVTWAERQVLPPTGHQLVRDVFPGGQRVAFVERAGLGDFHPFELSLTQPDAVPVSLLQPRLYAPDFRLSPDGRAMAYVQFDEPRVGIYVASLAMNSAPVLVDSIVNYPRWSADGRQVYYLSSDNRMMSVTVRTVPSLAVGIARPLFQMKQPAILLQVARDGRFLMLMPRVRAETQPITVATAAVGAARP
jgi:serine/threonine protein kinase/Tol biopolymer transport system component